MSAHCKVLLRQPCFSLTRLDLSKDFRQPKHTVWTIEKVQPTKLEEVEWPNENAD